MADPAEPTVTGVDKQERLKRLIDAGIGLHAELSLDALLQKLVEAAVSLTGARYGALGVLDRTGQILEQFITTGVAEETRATIGDLPRGRGILGLLIRERRPMRMRDLTEHPASIGFPPGHPPMRSFLGVPIMLRGVPYGNLYLTEREGGDFTDEDEDLVVLLASHAAVAIENARLYAALSRWSQRLTGLGELGDALTSELGTEGLLYLIASRLRELLEARVAYVLLLAPDGLLHVEAAVDADEKALIGMRFSLEGTKAGGVFRRRQPERVDSVIDDPEFDLVLARRTGISACICMPLVVRDQAIGILVVGDKLGSDPRFSDEDMRLAETIAARAAAAVDAGRRVARETVHAILEAQEAERRRLARELHDETAQALSSILLVLAPLERSAGEGAIRPIRELVSNALGNVRRLAVELRPSVLDDFGLVPALDRLVDDLRRRTTLRVEVVSTLGEERLAPELETALYRVAQEALSNVVEHARASSVVISLRRGDRDVTLIVEDDGMGFSPEDVAAERFGLVGMRERVALVRGTCEIVTGDEPGTRVIATVPVAGSV